jgi:hypothetical protein
VSRHPLPFSPLAAGAEGEVETAAAGYTVGGSFAEEAVMKNAVHLLLPLTAVAVLCVSLNGSPSPDSAAGAGIAAGASARVDEPPPPEPMDCPLCAGDARLHFARLSAIVRAGELGVALALGTR